MAGVVELAAAIAVAALLIWIGFRARRIGSGILRWSGMGGAGLLAAVAVLASGLAVAGLVKAHSRRAPVPDLHIAAAPGEIARGQEIADSFCAGCHSKTGILTGGTDLGKEIALPIGSFIAANLTPAGELAHWSDGEIFRAIRNGIDAEGHWLTIMSYTNAGKLSDDDIKALIAYIRSLPAGGTPTPDPPDSLSLPGLILLGAGKLPAGKPVFVGVITAPPKGATLAYGAYILSYQDCRECHGAGLTGGVEGQLAPIGPDLDVVKEWKREEFIAAMRTGVTPDGHHIGAVMPWQAVGRMDDVELSAIYEYLTHLPEAPAAVAD